jgi:micrococcal nuclease
MGWWPSSNSNDNNSNNNEKSSNNLPRNLLAKYFSLTPHAHQQQLDDVYQNALHYTNTCKKELDDLSSRQWMLVVGATSMASFLLGLKVSRRMIRPFYRPITSLQDLTSQEIGAQQASWLRGRVVSVSDGDTLRFLHQPFLSSFFSKNDTQYDKNHLLPIRLCSIDTPETAKFGKPGMKYGEQAKEQLQGLCLDQTVHVKILQLDQYGRAVALVRKRPKFFLGWYYYAYLDEAMLRAGLAEVYVGSGAVYGRLGNKEAYIKLMETAQASGQGMWADDQKNRESAAEYKRRTK